MSHRVAVIHPDLGIGGAERLIVDLSKALQKLGHDVTIYTGYHDSSRCFDETRDGTLKVVTVGQWIPRNLFGIFHALLAYLKIIYIGLYVMLFTKYDIVFCDQVPSCIPFLRLKCWSKNYIVFYCHHPDQLLTQRESWIKMAYRKPIDMFEEWSTGLADLILVNSDYTRTVVRRTFTSLQGRDLPELWPCVDLHYYKTYKKPSDEECDKFCAKHLYPEVRKKVIFLSLNRFERKKKIETAIDALKISLHELKTGPPIERKREKFYPKRGFHLIIAGGYDSRLKECRDYYEELKKLSFEDNGFTIEDISFVPSPNEKDKLMLLHLCDVVVYTPENEHFGIVPLEAMAMRKPVIASYSGGPIETIRDGSTGILCYNPDGRSFSSAMTELYHSQNRISSMGANGQMQVKHLFSFEAFTLRLEELCARYLGL